MHLVRVYAKFKNFGEFLASSVAIREPYITQYHELIAELERLSGTVLSDFMLSPGTLKPVKVTEDPFSSEFRYSTERFLDKQIFVSQFRALTSYFDQRFAES
jgi:hypothetical protein